MHHNKFARDRDATEEEKPIVVTYSTIGIEPCSSYKQMVKW